MTRLRRLGIWQQKCASDGDIRSSDGRSGHAAGEMELAVYDLRGRRGRNFGRRDGRWTA